MSTLYPSQVDTVLSLPTVIDNNTPVKADVVNRLRDAILAIETELGVKPSGIYGTVRTRLDILEALINAGGGGGGGTVIFSGDLTGVNTLQTVVGIQTRPVLSTAPSSNQFLGWTGSAWAPETITEDIVLPAFGISLSGGGFGELGQTFNNPAFTASYNRASATATLTDTEGNSQDVSSTPTSFSSVGSFTKTVFGETVTFTLTANDAMNIAVSKTSNAALEWVQLSYYGVGPASQSSAVFIQSLTGVLNNVRGMGFSVTAGSTDKVYFACRAAYGDASFSVGGFSGGFSLVSNTISVTNTYGIIEDYELYESDNLNLGPITVSVS